MGMQTHNALQQANAKPRHVNYKYRVNSGKLGPFMPLR